MGITMDADTSWRALLAECHRHRKSLSDKQCGFIDSLQDWCGQPTPKQMDRLHGLYNKVGRLSRERTVKPTKPYCVKYGSNRMLGETVMNGSAAIPTLRAPKPQAAPAVPKAELRRQAEVAYRQFKAAPARPAARPRPRTFENLNPCNPHDQLAGVDMMAPPW